MQETPNSAGALGTDPRAPLEGCQVGQTLEAVYREHYDYVFRLVRRLGIRDGGIDDVVHDVFIVVLRKLTDFRGESSIRTWIFGIVLRVVRTHRRSNHRHQRRVDALARETDLALPSDNSAVRYDARDMLLRLLDRLPEQQRVVFVLYELEQFSPAEISEMVDAPANTVYSRLRLARQQLDRAVARYRATESRRPS